ncbi:putative mediator of RNA polymerase II transcription subunit 29, partial [Penaeus japonicus]|uniref:putative mediator of RNA polymerase II transcription subunit 29 n=1 Tax=Penaeus japonicus TaxID=27405 RepID=UPI001C7171EA
VTDVPPQETALLLKSNTSSNNTKSNYNTSSNNTSKTTNNTNTRDDNPTNNNHNHNHNHKRNSTKGMCNPDHERLAPLAPMNNRKEADMFPEESQPSKVMSSNVTFSKGMNARDACTGSPRLTFRAKGTICNSWSSVALPSLATSPTLKIATPQVGRKLCEFTEDQTPNGFVANVYITSLSSLSAIRPHLQSSSVISTQQQRGSFGIQLGHLRSKGVTGRPDGGQPLPTSDNLCRLLPTSENLCRLLPTSDNSYQPLPTPANLRQLLPISDNSYQPLTTRANLRQLPTSDNSCQSLTTPANLRQLLPTSDNSCQSLTTPTTPANLRQLLPISDNSYQPLPTRANLRQLLPTSDNSCQSLTTPAILLQLLPTSANSCQPQTTPANL